MKLIQTAVNSKFKKYTKVIHLKKFFQISKYCDHGKSIFFS